MTLEHLEPKNPQALIENPGKLPGLDTVVFVALSLVLKLKHLGQRQEAIESCFLRNHAKLKTKFNSRRFVKEGKNLHLVERV